MSAAEFTLNVNADTAQARADIDRFRDVQQRKNIDISVDAHLSKASAEMAAWRGRQQADAVKIPVEVDRKKLLDSVQTFQSEVGNAFSGGLKAINLPLIGIGAIPAATTALVDLAGAIQQVAGAGLALPGIMAGVGSSVGTLVLGLSGISDAYKAVSKAADTPSVDQVSSARAAAQASQQLRNAVVDETQAQKDRAQAYKDARQELEDLNIEARGGTISEAQAVNDALKARRDLAKGGFKDQLDYQDALLRVQSADQRVVEVHQRNIETQDKLNDANQKGVENSDRVTAANERVVRSHQQVADAQTGVADASKKTSAAVLEANKAMALLGPNAQDVVNTLVSLKPTFQDFRTAISQPLLQGVSQEIRTLVSTDLPILQSGMARIATSLNQNFGQLTKSLTSGQSQGLLDRILGNTADAQSRLTAAIDPIVRALGTLTAAGSDALPRIADDIAKISERFANFIDAADKDGRLDKWINDGVTGFEHLGSILLNLAKSFTDITGAAGGGAGLLGTLDTLTGKLHDFLSSDAGQAKLREFFQRGREDLEKWLPIFQNLLGMLPGLLDAAQHWMEVWLPPLREATQLLAKHPDLVQAVVLAFAAWKTIEGVASLVKSLQTIKDLLDVVKSGAAAIPAIASAVTGQAGALTAAGPAGAATLPGASAAAAGAAVAAPVAALAGLALMVQVAQSSQASDQQKLDTFNTAYSSVASPDEKAQVLQTYLGSTQLGKATPGRGVPAQTGPGAAVKKGSPLEAALLEQVNAGKLSDYEPDGRGWIRNKNTHAPLPRYQTGGPTEAGMALLHGGEYVQQASAVNKYGVPFMSALNDGRFPAFQGGGYIDQYGNPVTPGMLPGPSTPPASVAPNPYGASSILGSLTSGLSGSIGNIVNFANSNSSSSTAGGTRLLPGFAGLAQAASSPDPQAAMGQWGSQTSDWLGNFFAKTALGFGSALWSGALGAVGLQNSILSPQNVYNQALQRTAGFFLGDQGPLASGTGTSASGTGTTQLGSQSITLGDGSTINIPTFGTSTGTSASSTATSASTTSASSAGILPAGMVPDWEGTAQGESGGNWAINTGNGFFGGLQFKQSSWEAAGGTKYAARADLATKDQQIEIANKLLQMQGPGAWPNTFKTKPAAASATTTAGTLVPRQWSGVDAIGAQFGLTMTSGYRDPNGPTVAGVAANQSYHGSGRAHDYGGTPAQRLAFATFMAQNYGPQLKELIYDAPGFNLTIKDGQVKGPFGAFYTLGQAGDHTDHVHIAFGRGGQTPGAPGAAFPAVLHGGEYVQQSSAVDRYGAGFMSALNEGRIDPRMLPRFADGGFATAVIPPIDPNRPSPKRDIGAPAPPPLPVQVIPPPGPVTPAAPQPYTPAAPAPSALGPPAFAPPPAPATPQEPQPAPIAGGYGPSQVAAAPKDLNHNLAAINTAITSTASTLGNIVNMAVQAAAATGSFGASAAAGGGGAGSAGSLVSGLFQEGGKIAEDVVNVGSSFLVGSVPGSFGTTANPYGQQLRPQQNIPVTAPGRVQNNVFNGMDVPRVFQELDLRNAQDQQAALAHRPR